MKKILIILLLACSTAYAEEAEVKTTGTPCGEPVKSYWIEGTKFIEVCGKTYIAKTSVWDGRTLQLILLDESGAKEVVSK